MCGQCLVDRGLDCDNIPHLGFGAIYQKDLPTDDIIRTGQNQGDDLRTNALIAAGATDELDRPGSLIDDPGVCGVGNVSQFIEERLPNHRSALAMVKHEAFAETALSSRRCQSDLENRPIGSFNVSNNGDQPRR